MGRKPKINKDWLQAPKGMKDIFGEDYYFRKEIFNRAEDLAGYYGFLPISLPHIEKEELFTKTLGETSDVVEKQMFVVKSGGDRLVLRPEATAGIMRAYFEHGMHTLPQPIMLYTLGSFFRHERPQKGRFREFNQFNLEILGEEDSIADALIIRTISLILSEMGLQSFIVHINSLGDKECAPLYRKELISFLRKKVNYLCRDCKRRLKINPLRILDCKEEKCVQLKQDAPQMFNYLCEECKKHLESLLEYLETLNIPYLLDNFLVRGFDYYSRTVFEIFENGNDQKFIENPAIALAAGGRYDYLGDILGGKHVPGVGVATGIERLLLTLKERNIKFKQEKPPKLFLIQLGDLAKRKSLLLMENLRKANISLRHSLSKDNIRSQLKSASALKIKIVLIIGQKEALEEKVIIRDMETGSQEILQFTKAIEYLKNNGLARKFGTE